MDETKIEWCDSTFNPWIGCSKVSAGCAHCYAETLMDKRYGRVQWGDAGTRSRTSAAYWRKPFAWNRKSVGERRRRVFCASLADVFEDRTELIGWRGDLFNLIRATPALDWLLLTKRPENVLRMAEELPANIWIGTSVENQQAADQRIPKLMRIPASVRFVSAEPLLGPIDLSGFEQKPDWVIVGGESGPNARAMNPGWARLLHRQCRKFDIAFFFKQWGAWRPATEWESVDGNVDPHDKGRFRISASRLATSDLMVRVGKKKAGRELDGEKWSEFPVPRRR